MVEPWSFSRVQKDFHNPFFFILREQKREDVHLKNRLRALYAQSFRITLAPPVLPRLLARSWPGLFLKSMSSSSYKSEVYSPVSLRPPKLLV